jgi:hypothetical protein
MFRLSGAHARADQEGGGASTVGFLFVVWACLLHMYARRSREIFPTWATLYAMIFLFVQCCLNHFASLERTQSSSLFACGLIARADARDQVHVDRGL